MDFDTAVKLSVYNTVAETGVTPTSLEVAKALAAPQAAIEAAFVRLQSKRLLVVGPGDSSRIRMAPPFSGVETPFLVRSRGRSYYANCAWDAFGVPAALHRDATIDASDGFTGEPITLHVSGDAPVSKACV